MILKSLFLENFKGLLAGVGLDRIEIDFDKLPDGIIALVGGNGMGKTTILDNLHPYRLMPYKLRKSGSWSPAAFSFYDECEGEARKELTFEMGGRLYKSVVLIDAVRRKQEAYLYFLDEDASWDTDQVQWSPLNDGKTKTYDEALEKVCGSPSLFFTSVFRSQGAKNLSDYTRGDIMAIVAELLNIDHIREQGEKAKAVADSLQAERDELARQAATLRSTLEGEEAVSLRHAGRLQERKAAEEQLVAVDACLADYDERLRKAEAAVASYAADRQRLADKQKQLADLNLQADAVRGETNRAANDLTTEMQRARSASEATVSRMEADGRALADDLAVARSRHSTALSEINLKVARYEKIRGGGEAIRAAVKKEAELVEAIAYHKRLLAEARSAQEALRVENLKATKVQADLNSERRRMEMLEQQAAGMSVLDCRADGSMWVNEVCPLLAGAVKAKHEAEAIRVTVEALAAEFAPLRASLEENKEREAAEVVRGREQALATDEASLTEAQRFTRLLPDLELADQQLVELAEQKTRMADDLMLVESRTEERLAANREAVASEKANLQTRISELQLRLEVVHSGGEASVALLDEKAKALAAEVSALDLSLLDNPETEAERVRLAISGRKSERQAVAANLTALASQIGGLETQLAGFAKVRDDLSGVEAKAGGFDSDIADWRLLQKACSNDGIIALEIDDSGPSISAIANDLLKTCYGPRFSVRIETQSEKVGGGAKEDFDITVFDAETGEQKSITVMSGGQVCWIEDALTRAICLFNIQRADRVFGTLYSDEKDGALDADRKQAFVAVKRRSLEIGTHRRELFITQTPELVDLADGVIRLSPGKVEMG